MKRIAWAFLIVLGSTIMMHAQEAEKMTGTICNAPCVIQKPDIASCDAKCDITGGESVFIDDAGRAKKVTNQEKCSAFVGKHVTMMAVPAGMPGLQRLTIQEIQAQPH